MVSVSVSENSETVLTILSAIEENKRIDETFVMAAKNLGINLAFDKYVSLVQSYSSESNETIISIEENQSKMVSCDSDDLLNLSDEKEEIHDIKSQINSEMLLNEEQDANVKHIKVTPSKKHKSALVCDVCKVRKGFQTRQAHQRHMIKNHNTHISCDQCSEEFTEVDAYKGHIFKVHGQAKMCPCPHCGIVVQKRCLRKHIFSKHTIMELKNCPNCEYTNKNVKEVEIHYKSQKSAYKYITNKL